MTSERIFKVVVDGIVDLMDTDRETIKSETQLVADLGMDSLDYVELVMYVEGELGLHIPDDPCMDLDSNTVTVQKLVDFIQREGEPE